MSKLKLKKKVPVKTLPGVASGEPSPEIPKGSPPPVRDKETKFVYKRGR